MAHRSSETEIALKRWLRDDALNDVDPSITDGLPEEWKELWADVDALLKRAPAKK